MHIGMSGMMKLLCVRWIEFMVTVFYFYHLPAFPGLGFGTVLRSSGLVARVSQSLISPPFLIKIKHP